MEFALKQYLDYNQDYKGQTVYNLPFWQCSVFDPILGVNSLNIVRDKNELRTFILIHKMSFSNVQSGAVVTFIDSRYPSQPLLQYNDVFETGGIYPFVYISKGTSLNIICSNNNWKFSFFIQIVTQEKERK